MEKKIVLVGEFESSKKNLGRDLSKNGLDKLIKRGVDEKPATADDFN
jgi:hypothetical protein